MTHHTADFEHDTDGAYLLARAVYRISVEHHGEEWEPCGNTFVLREPAGWSYEAHLESIPGLNMDRMAAVKHFGVVAIERNERAVAENYGEEQ